MQPPSRAAAVLLAALVTLGAAGCGGDNGSGPKSATALDPELVTSTMTRVDEILDQPAVQVLFFDPAFNGQFTVPLRAAGLPLPRRTTLPFALPRASAARTGATGVQTLAAPWLLDEGIPVGVRGRTYLFDQQNRRWTRDVSRSGAPANGVRMLFGPTAAAPAGAVVASVDVQDLSTTSEARIVTTVRSGAGAVVLTYDDKSTRANPFEPGFSQTIAGSVSKNTDRLTFNMSTSITNEGASGIGERSTFNWALPSANVSMDSGYVARDAAGDSSYSLMRIGTRSLRTVNRYVRDPDFGGYVESDTTSVYLDDRLYAYVIIPSDATDDSDVRVVRPNGTSLPSDEYNTLLRQQMSVFGVSTLLFVPRLVEGWVMGLGSGA